MKKIGEVAMTVAERSRKYYYAHKEREAERNKQYHEENRSKIRVRHRAL